MSQSLNGTLALGSDIVRLSRDPDFQDFLAFSTHEAHLRAAEALSEICRSFGDRRTPSMDLYRQRQRQLAQHLNTVH